MRSPCWVCSSGGQAEAGSIHLSAQSPRQVGVPHTWVRGQAWFLLQKLLPCRTQWPTLKECSSSKPPKGSSSGMRSPCCVCSSGGQAEAGSIRLSAQSPRQVGVPHTSVYGQEQIHASQGVALTESAQAEADSIRISLQSPRQVGVPHTSVCGQHLAVVSEAMLRLCWNKVEPLKQGGTPGAKRRGLKRSEGGILLRTDHMLGGAHSKSALRAKQHLYQTA